MQKQQINSQILSHLPYLFAIAYNLLAKVDEAEDAVQECLCKFFHKKKLLRNPQKLRSYLAKMVANYCLDQLRRKRYLVFLEEVDAHKNFVAKEKSEESGCTTDCQLEEWLSRLAPKDRLVIDLFYRENLSIQEISKVISDSPGAVKVRLHRARKSLRTMAKQDLQKGENGDNATQAPNQDAKVIG